MANYTPDQVAAAVKAGLISQEDAQYLMQELQTTGTPWGGIAGGAALGLAGAALGGMGGQAVAKRVGDWGKKAVQDFDYQLAGSKLPEDSPAFDPPGLKDKAKNYLGQGAEFLGRQHKVPGMDNYEVSNLSMLGASAGGGAGAGLGAWGGNAMMPAAPGEGVEGGPWTAGEDFDRDSALRTLIDPSTPADVKKQIMQMLQQFDQQNPPAEQGYGEGMPWGAMAGGALGAALGGAGGQQLGKRAPAWLGDTSSIGKSMGDNPGWSQGGLGAGLGALGLGGGAMAGGAMAPRRPSPYEDPLSVG